MATGASATSIPEPSSPSTRKTSLGLVFVIVFIDLLGFAIVLPLLPRYASRLHASDGTIGLLFASFSAMQFIFSPLWGRLSDRIGRRPALLAGLAGSVIFYTLFGLASVWESLTLMFVARIGAGIAGATISTAQAYIADATGLQGRAKGMALIGAAFGGGVSFGPIIGALSLPKAANPGDAVEALNAFPMYIAASLSGIALIVAFFKLPESLRAGAVPSRRTWLNIGAIREAMRVPSVGQLLLLFFLTTFAFAQFESTLSRLTDVAFSRNEQDNFLLFSYIGITLCFMQGVVVRRLVTKIGEPLMIIAGTVLMGTGLWLVSIAAEQRSFHMLLWLMPILVGGFSFVTPSVQSLISRRSDPARQGEILGVNQSAASMARIFGPWLGNVLFGKGYILPYQTATALIVPALLMAIFTASSGQDWRAADATLNSGEPS
jgi:DHA1 family tetracycline resistance protein-like MFS transporter